MTHETNGLISGVIINYNPDSDVTQNRNVHTKARAAYVNFAKGKSIAE